MKNKNVQWLIGTILILFLLLLDSGRVNYLPDLTVVRCAGIAVMNNSDPYASLNDICNQKVLLYAYPPAIAFFSAFLINLLGEANWIYLFQCLIASAFALIFVVAFRSTTKNSASIFPHIRILLLSTALGGGILITAFRSGNIAILFWAALAGTTLWWRNPRACLAVVVAGSIVKIHLAYLLIVPILIGGSIWAAVAGSFLILISYALQSYYSSELFAKFIVSVKEISTTPGYTGAGSFQVAEWISNLTGFTGLALPIALGIAALLCFFARTLIFNILRSQEPAVTGEMMALMLLTLFMMSPRMQHYDTVFLIPVLCALWNDERSRVPLAIGMIAIPVLLRAMLTLIKIPSINDWVFSTLYLDYDSAFALYLGLVWLSFIVTTIVLLKRSSTQVAAITQPQDVLQEST